MKRETTLYSQNCTATSTPISNGREYFEIHRAVAERIPFADVDKITEELWRAYEDRRKVFLFGNGGSASLACHLACDLGKGTAPEAGRRLRAVALTDNAALITAWANDTRYDQIFAEQLQNLLRPLRDLVHPEATLGAGGACLEESLDFAAGVPSCLTTRMACGSSTAA